jgi:hypothetical protein
MEPGRGQFNSAQLPSKQAPGAMDQIRFLSDCAFHCRHSFLLTVTNVLLCMVRFRSTPRRVHRGSHARKIAPLTPLFPTLMKGAVSPLSTAHTSAPGSTLLKSETQAKPFRRSARRPRPAALAVLCPRLCVTGFGIPDPVDVTASRIHPFGSPLFLQSAI